MKLKTLAILLLLCASASAQVGDWTPSKWVTRDNQHSAAWGGDPQAINYVHTFADNVWAKSGDPNFGSHNHYAAARTSASVESYTQTIGGTQYLVSQIGQRSDMDGAGQNGKQGYSKCGVRLEGGSDMRADVAGTATGKAQFTGLVDSTTPDAGYDIEANVYVLRPDGQKFPVCWMYATWSATEGEWYTEVLDDSGWEGEYYPELIVIPEGNFTAEMGVGDRLIVELTQNADQMRYFRTVLSGTLTERRPHATLEVLVESDIQ